MIVNFRKATMGLAVLGALTMLPASATLAWTKDVGQLFGNCTHTETLTSGGQITLDTIVFYNSQSQLYTYQYNLLNQSDPDLRGIGVDVSGATDPSSLQYFFGSAVQGSTVYEDSQLGSNGSLVVNDGRPDQPPSKFPTEGAILTGDEVLFGTLPSSGGPQLYIDQGQSSQSEYGDYWYIQSKTAPGPGDINILDSANLNSGGQSLPVCFIPGGHQPVVPESGTMTLFGLGSLALLPLGLRARRRAAC